MQRGHFLAKESGLFAFAWRFVCAKHEHHQKQQCFLQTPQQAEPKVKGLDTLPGVQPSFVFLLHERKVNNMIPDDATTFNTTNAAPKHFDDPEGRLRYRLGQDAVPTEGGRHLLYCCPLCKHPWYKAGRSEYPRLTVEQLTQLGEALHADTGLLHTFPQALCSICSVIYLGGTFSVEEYCPDRPPYRQGYRFMWEDATAPQTHLIGMICQRERLTNDRLLRMQPDILTMPVSQVRAVLAWMEALPYPNAIFGYADEESQDLGRQIPPQPDSDGTPRIWRGYSWIQVCPPLHGDVLISLASALHPLATYSFPRLFASWKLLARMMRVIL